MTDEVERLKGELETLRCQPHVTLKEMLQNRLLRRPLTIAIMMMLAQQLSGINAAIFFSTQIFRSAGLDASASQWASVGTGVINFLMTFVSMVLIDRSGRKTLMLTGLLIMFISTGLLFLSLLMVESVTGFSYLAIIAVNLFIIGFATGPGSIPWFFVTELFTQAGRPMATSIANSVNWAANFIIGLSFSPIEHGIGAYVFVIFLVLQLGFIIYVWLVVPETKNKTAEEVTQTFIQ